ncbi:hypothetical protein [Spongiactinospora sp. TRM90649]|uniref:hypothetical protein n=1 Tax=Spongiactinospora sp. TRM90649 TaxID=3031114 RepID=UPI0023F7DA32|nr:hypothetical protein [Spongiactinospora sp. TRM90649]MDF5753843.1 hypothetical protein [Spongiactinospora sp. TRM90649]
MFRRSLLAAAALVGAAALMSPALPATAATPSVAGPVAGPAAVAPAKVAKKLFSAWNARDRRAAARVATPSAVSSIFAYVYRTPDRFDGCDGRVCRFVHTSVRVPGDLNGIAMVVSGGKVVKVYRSRHLVRPQDAAKHLYGAWRRHDRYAGLEVATRGAVRTIFRVRFDPSGVPYHFQGCSPEPGGRSCAYSYEGGAMLMSVRGSKTTGYHVRSIRYIAD